MAGWPYALLGWVGGVVSAVAGSWINGRVQSYEHERKAHRDDLREEVLKPLRAGIDKYLGPLINFQEPLLSIEHAATEFDFNAGVTEEPMTYGPHLVARFPSASVFGPIGQALLHDAQSNHFSQLFLTFDRFYEGWMAYSADCHIWAARLAQKILDSSQLQPFPKTGPAGTYVMHYRLAVFLYLRLFRFPSGALQKEEDGERCLLKGGSYTLALGTEKQIDALIKTLDDCQESEGETALQRRDRGNMLQSQYQAFQKELDYAIAARRLHGGCDFVTFF